MSGKALKVGTHKDGTSDHAWERGSLYEMMSHNPQAQKCTKNSFVRGAETQQYKEIQQPVGLLLIMAQISCTQAS